MEEFSDGYSLGRDVSRKQKVLLNVDVVGRITLRWIWCEGVRVCVRM